MGFASLGSLGTKSKASRNILAVGDGFPNTSLVLVEHGNNVSYFRLDIKWQDEFLSWNVSQAKGIEDLRLDIEDIWVPDIEVYNLVSRKGLREREQAGVIIFGTEDSIFSKHCKHKSHLSIQGSVI